MKTERIQLIGLGELLWDCFPDRRLPGGAPANVAFHAQQLGLSAAVVSRVGRDDLGEEICQFLTTQGLRTDFIQRDPEHPTGTVTIDAEGSSDNNYRFLENSAWDFLELGPELLGAVRSADAICFGTLAQRRSVSRSTIDACLQSAPRDCLIVYDVNLRPPHVSKAWIARSLEFARVVKLNVDEVVELSRMFDFYSVDEIRFAKYLLDRYRQLDLVCVTRGRAGCVAVTCGEELEFSGIPIDVVDTVGAGDAFTAAVILGRLSDWPLSKTIDLANRYGALVASHAGAMPVLKAELESLKSQLDWAFRETPPV